MVGFWQHIEERRVNVSTGEVQRTRQRAPSVIVYTPGGFVGVHFPTPGRVPFAGDTPTLEEAEEAFRGYLGYYGALALYPGEVSHNVLGGVQPSAGAILRRYADITGDELVVTIQSLAQAPDRPQFATTVHLRRLSGVEGERNVARFRGVDFFDCESLLSDDERAVRDTIREWVDEQFDPSVTWADLAWVRENWPGKVILKGILDVDDARRAADHGADGIVVSNHGGRQLDAVPSTAVALPPIVSAVGDQLEVLVDGGVRSGLDVVKMLSLGARAVLIGRAWAWAVAARGEVGVAHVLAVIREEMHVALGLTGVTDVADLSADMLVK